MFVKFNCESGLQCAEIVGKCFSHMVRGSLLAIIHLLEASQLSSYAHRDGHGLCLCDRWAITMTMNSNKLALTFKRLCTSNMQELYDKTEQM